MAQPLKTYDPSLISFIAGVNQLTGWADGTKIEIEMDDDAWMLKVGTDGDATRIKSLNKSATITLTFQSSSLSNAILMGYYLADQANNAGTFPAICKDSGGTSVAAAANVWVQKIPNTTYAKDLSDRVWKLQTDSIEMFVGGN